jgi:hypothetical protein
MPDVNNPQIGVLDKIMNAVRISCDETATQLRSLRVANSQMRSRSDKCDRVENRPTHSTGGSRILFGDEFQNFCGSFRARGVNRSVIDRAA